MNGPIFLVNCEELESKDNACGSQRSGLVKGRAARD